MFLSKKGFTKVLIMVICYIALGSICIALWVAFSLVGAEAILLLILGVTVYLLCALIALWGLYAEGKGKLLNTAQKLVRVELRPADFIKEYETLKGSSDLVINKPSFEILQILAVAYDTLDDRKACLATIEEMIAAAPAKKKVRAELFVHRYCSLTAKKKKQSSFFTSCNRKSLMR